MGLHGLQQYAGAKWLNHLEMLSKACAGLNKAPESNLRCYIEMLCARHDRLLDAGARVARTYQGNKVLHGRLQAFQGFDSLRALAGAFWTFEREAIDMSPMHAQGNDHHTT